MKTIFLNLIFFINIFYSYGQDNEKIIGMYGVSSRNGISYVSINKDKIAYCITITLVGDINFVSYHPYRIINDTVKIDNYMNYYWKDNTLYWFNNKNEVVLKGGLKKASSKIIKRIQKRYEAQLRGYNLCIRNGLIEKL